MRYSLRQSLVVGTAAAALLAVPLSPDGSFLFARPRGRERL
jgi:hypothetical protein